MSPTDYCHDLPDRTGILLVNLGTPDTPDRASVRRYLKEFLWDPRVVEGPRWTGGWRSPDHPEYPPRKSAAAYQKIWTDQGSPLLLISRRQEQALRERLAERHGDDIRVALGMRYGSPSIASGLQQLRDAGARRVLVLPLYPQYSATTTASIFDEVTHVLHGWRWLPELRFINHYHDDPAYIAALEREHPRVAAGARQRGKLLLSFHGIPQDYFDKGDPISANARKPGACWPRRWICARISGPSASSRAWDHASGCSPIPTRPCNSWPARASNPYRCCARASPPTVSRPSRRLPWRTAASSWRPVGNVMSTSPV